MQGGIDARSSVEGVVLLNLGGSGVVGFAMMFRAVAVMVVLVAVAASNTRLGVSAAVLYALAYSLELGLSVVAYFSGPPR